MVKRQKRVPKLPRREAAGHKGTYGTAVVLAGSVGMLGAAILCARGALRGGAGLVRVGLPGELMGHFAGAVPAAVSFDRRKTEPAWFAGASSVVCGPGLGQGAEAKSVFDHVLGSCDVPVVLDADGLNLCGKIVVPFALQSAAVLTPHPGEAGRLLGTSSGEVQADRQAAVEELAHRSGQVVVLKGEGSLVCDGEQLYENTTGNPGMATGGSGDVLAGLIGALIAQGMEPFDAACLGVHAHGCAGDLVAERLSQAGLCAEDPPLAIAEVLR